MVVFVRGTRVKNFSTKSVKLSTPLCAKRGSVDRCCDGLNLSTGQFIKVSCSNPCLYGWGDPPNWSRYNILCSEDNGRTPIERQRPSGLSLYRLPALSDSPSAYFRQDAASDDAVPSPRVPGFRGNGRGARHRNGAIGGSQLDIDLVLGVGCERSEGRRPLDSEVLVEEQRKGNDGIPARRTDIVSVGIVWR